MMTKNDKPWLHRGSQIVCCAIVVGTALTACAKPTYFVPITPPGSLSTEDLSIRSSKFPTESDRVGTITPPGSLNEAYRQQFAKCFSIERERDRQATTVSASRYLTGAVGIVLGVVGSALIAYSAQKKAEDPTASTSSIIAAGSGFVGGGIALSSIASFVNFERRIDANRRHREEVRRAMMRANAEWNGSTIEGDKESETVRKARLLKNMADVCGTSADLESALGGRSLDEIIKEASDKTTRALAKDPEKDVPDPNTQPVNPTLPPPPVVPPGKPGVPPTPIAPLTTGAQPPPARR